jgi:hypothetical protein
MTNAVAFEFTEVKFFEIESTWTTSFQVHFNELNLGAATLGIKTFGITTLSIIDLFVTFIILIKCIYH